MHEQLKERLIQRKSQSNGVKNMNHKGDLKFSSVRRVNLISDCLTCLEISHRHKAASLRHETKCTVSEMGFKTPTTDCSDCNESPESMTAPNISVCIYIIW